MQVTVQKKTAFAGKDVNSKQAAKGCADGKPQNTKIFSSLTIIIKYFNVINSND